MDPKVWWYLSRSSGLVAWAMLTASVLWGVMLATPMLGRFKRAAWLLDLHRWLGALALIFTGMHVGALMADRTVSFGLSDVLVPFASAWNPVGVAWGVVSLWLVAAVQLTSMARRHLPRRVWHAIHLTSYGTFWAVSIHGATVGTDASTWIYQAGAVTALGATLFATLYRVLIDDASPRRRTPTTRRSPAPSIPSN